MSSINAEAVKVSANVTMQLRAQKHWFRLAERGLPSVAGGR